MGATNFDHDVAISDDGSNAAVEDAWRSARESAYYDHGHDPYNGSITTNSSYRVYDQGQIYTTDEVQILIQQRLDADDGPQKWGPCEVVATCESAEDRTQTGWTFYGWAAI